MLKIECPKHTYVDNEKALVVKEKQYGSFRPDILLKKEDDVYFIEIYVSHPCEKPKIASGIRIIEIKPANERAEQELISGDTILSKGNNYSIEYYNFPELTTSYDFIHNLHLSYVVMHKDKRLEVYGKDTLVVRNSDLLLLAVDAQPDFAMEIGKAYAFKKGLLDEADLSANELRLDIPAIIKYLNMINIPISQ